MFLKLHEGPNRTRRAMFFGIAFALATIAPCQADLLDLRMQIVWGGGVERQWKGRIFVENGAFSDLRLLGADADSPGTVLAGQQIVIRQKSPRTLDGIELTVRGKSDAVLRIEMLSVGNIKTKHVRLPLQELVDRPTTVALDNERNELRVGRLSFDRIRVDFDRKHLVFRPKEPWTFHVSPHMLSKTGIQPTRCQMKLVSADTGEEVWSNGAVLKSDLDGRYERIKNVRIAMPDVEGVYNLDIEFSRPGRRFTLRNKKIVATRRVQVVVISNAKADPSNSEEQLVLEFDPAERNWWSTLMKLPQWYLLPGFKQNGPLGNHKALRLEHQNKVWTQLEEKGWQAYPLPVEEIGQQHELQIEYPSDQPQTTFFSIIEPNASGKVLPIGLDTGIDLAAEDATGVAARPFQIQKHRIPFWPRTKSPLLLVKNQRPDQRSTYGKIRILRTEGKQRKIVPSRIGRKLIAQWHRPLFNQAFSAREAYDAKNGGSFEDWQTFYEGGSRMIRHLKSAGYNGIALSVYSDGSTLYPSRFLLPTPKHDRGVYFTDGRDPIRKDVLEMLFRICDREGMELIPIVDFATPLPALERTKRHDPQDAKGIVLVNHLGQSWEENHGTRLGRAPYYNPLSNRVQLVMLAVVRELCERYGFHQSFGGIQLAMTPESYTHLPGIEWGLDTTTIRWFQSDTQQLGDIKKSTLRNVRQMILSKKVRPHWQKWRCGELSEFYKRLQEEVNRHATNSKLYLSTTQLAEAEPLQSVLTPKLLPEQTIRDGLGEMGLDFELLAANKNIGIQRPYRISPVIRVTRHGTDLELNTSAELDAIYNSFQNSTAEYFHVAQRVRLPSFDEVSPFGKEKTFTSLVTHVSNSDHVNRRRFIRSMAIQDPSVIFDGGWMVPLGQENSLGSFSNVFRQLPKTKFVTVEDPVHPLVIRKAVVNRSTYYYIVNNSPWDVGATLRFRMPANTRVIPLGSSEQPFRFEGRLGTWEVNLRPYDLVACRIAMPNPELLNVAAEFPPNVEPLLTQRVDNLRQRMASLKQLANQLQLQNHDFEQAVNNRTIPAWTVISDSDSNAQVIRIDDQNQAIRCKSESDQLVIASSDFNAPESRQLGVSLRYRSPLSQPPESMKVFLTSGNASYSLWKPIEIQNQKNDGRNWNVIEFEIEEIPEDCGLSVQLHIEISGECDFLIDDVKIFDRLQLQPGELVALNDRIFLVKHFLQKRDYAACLNLIHGYWPRYLMEQVPAPESTNVAERPQNRRKRKGSWDRLRGVLDKTRLR